MKKLFASLLMLFCMTSWASEKKFSFLVAHKNGGTGAAYQLWINDALKAKGWNIDFKIVGNCGQVKSLLQSDRPVMSGWDAAWQSDVKNACFLDTSESNFVDVFVVTPRFLCGPNDAKDFALVPGKSYTVGVNAGQNHHKMLDTLGSTLGIKFKTVEYRNSGSIKQALAAKEIDLSYTIFGLTDHRSGSKKCFYSSSDRAIQDIKPLKSVLTGPFVDNLFAAYLVTNQGFDPSVKQQLVKDVQAIIDSPEYQQMLDSAGSYTLQTTTKQKIDYVSKVAKSYQ